MRETTYQGSKLSIQKTRTSWATHHYKVDLLEGQWPDAEDIITLCDGYTPPEKSHFGGKVEKFGNSAYVEVYID